MKKKKSETATSSPSRDEFLAQAVLVSRQLATAYAFGYHTADDVRQECLVLAIEAYDSGAYDPAVGAPGPFLRRHFTFKLRTKFRSEVCRAAPPCGQCGSGNPCGGGDKECPPYREWLAANYQKGTLARPAFPCSIQADRPISGGIDEVEFLDLVDSLPADLRAAAMLLMYDERAAVDDKTSARLREALAASYGAE